MLWASELTRPVNACPGLVRHPLSARPGQVSDKGKDMEMSENPPEAPSLEALQEVMRKATLDGMKDYDREREEWEAAVNAQKPPDTPADDKPKKGSWSDFLLTGKRGASE